MIQKKKEISNDYNSGVLMICIKSDRRIKRDLIKCIHFANETLGANRFYNARVAGSAISRVIRIPYQEVLKNEDCDKYVTYVDGVWYEVDLIQIKYDHSIPEMKLTLKKGGINYIDERYSNQ